MAVSIGPKTGHNLQGYWSGNHVFFEYAECYWSTFKKSRYVYIPRKLCTESAVPEEATRQGKVPGQENKRRVFSVTLGALNPSSLRRISPSPSP